MNILHISSPSSDIIPNPLQTKPDVFETKVAFELGVRKVRGEKPEDPDSVTEKNTDLAGGFADVLLLVVVVAGL